MGVKQVDERERLAAPPRLRRGGNGNEYSQSGILRGRTCDGWRDAVVGMRSTLPTLSAGVCAKSNRQDDATDATYLWREGLL